MTIFLAILLTYIMIGMILTRMADKWLMPINARGYLIMPFMWMPMLISALFSKDKTS